MKLITGAKEIQQVNPSGPDNRQSIRPLTHFNSLHLHMAGDKRELFQHVLTTKASLHASAIY